MTMDFDTSAFLAAAERTVQRTISAAERGMGDAVDALINDSRNLAPLDTGTLRSSAYGTVEAEGTKVTGTVTYSVTEQSASGERFNYALYQHELGESYANPTTPGTQPKFLERPLKENAEKYLRIAAEEIRKELT